MDLAHSARTRSDGLVVTYHYVRPANSDGVTGISAEEFAKQLTAIARSHRILGVDEFLAAIRSPMRRSDAADLPPALITFDDAVKDQYRHALPVLARLGVPAVFFAPMRPVDPSLSALDAWTPQHLVHALAETLGWSVLEEAVRCRVGDVPIDEDRMNALYHYEVPAKRWLKFALAFAIPAEQGAAALHAINRSGPGLRASDWFMDREELLDLQSRGHALGGHGYDHLAYSTLTPVEQAWDMGRAAGLMTKLFGKRPRALAYPFGRHEDTTQQLAKAFGYTHGFTTDERVDCKYLDDALASRSDHRQTATRGRAA
jgi:peptidoglycan/xylan/chitin deacetylase (PgdA/CDA1 family)